MGVGVGLVGITILFSTTFFLDLRERREEMADNLALTGEVFNRPLQQSLWALDMVQVQLQVDSIASLPGIDIVTLDVTDGGQLNAGSLKSSGSIIEKTVNIIHRENDAEHHLATLTLTKDMTGFLLNLLKFEALELVGTGVVVIILLLGVLWLFQVSFTTRLLAIATATRNLTAADLKTQYDGSDIPNDAPDRDELDELAASILQLRKTGYSALMEAQESEAKFRLLAESIKEVFWLADPISGELLYVSPSYEDIWGKSAQSLIDDPFSYFDTIVPEDQSRVTRHIPIRVDQQRSQEYRIQHPDGSIRWVHDRAFPVSDEHGHVYRIVGVAEDITERKIRDLEREARKDELEGLVSKRTAELEQARDSAESASRSKSLFLANMSHEIRTPMNGVLGTVEILEQSTLDSGQHKMVRTIQNSAKSLLRIIDDILDVSKIEAGKLELNATPTNLLKVIERAVETVTPLADEKAVQLVMCVGFEVPRRVKLDTTRLNQILVNLLSNAIKFSQKTDAGNHGRVVLKVTLAAKNRVNFEVEDNGIGMSPAMQARLFKPFERDDAVVRESIIGTGLGLVITKNLVELLKGEIRFQSTLTEGTTFTVSLPINPIKPDIERLDIKGAPVFCMVNEQYHRKLSQTILESCGAAVSYIDDVDDLTKAIEASAISPIILLSLDSLEKSYAVRDHVRLVSQKGKFMMQTRDRSAKLGWVKDDIYVIQRYPVLMSQFESALAELAGGRPHAPDLSDSTVAPLAKYTVSSNSQAHILLVEDNEVNQYVISEQLKLLGFSHEIGSNGAEGLSKWKEGEFDLLLADCQMPVMDGFELTSRIREIEQVKNNGRLPIVAITANALTGERERCLEMGMDDYLSKPLELAKLKECLERLL